MSNQTFVCSFLVGLPLALLGCAEPAPPPRPVSATSATGPLVEAHRALGGRWHCRGAMSGADGAQSDSEVELDVSLVLDGAWLRTNFTTSAGKNRYAFVSYRSHDRTTNEWSNVIIDNLGGIAHSRSTDAVTWTGDSRGPMGTMSIKDTETVVAPETLKIAGQFSTDGKIWNTGYDLTCRR